MAEEFCRRTGFAGGVDFGLWFCQRAGMDTLEPGAATVLENGRKTQSKWRRRVLVSGAILIVLCVVLRALLPVLVERAAAYASRNFLGLPARIGNVDFALWVGGLVLEDVSVGSLPDGVGPGDAALRPPAIDPDSALLHFNRISVKWSWSDLFERKLLLKEVSVDAPAVRVLREADGKIDPLRHSKPAAPASPGETRGASEANTSRPWTIEIEHFVLRSPTVFLVEETSRQNLIEFSLEGFELDRVSLRGNEVGFGAVAVRGPVLSVQHELVFREGMLPAQPAEKDAGGPAPVPANQASPSVHIEAVNVERAKFVWISKDGPLDVHLTLKASGLTAEQGKQFPVDASLQIGSGKIALTGDVGILPPFFKGRAKWEGLAFPPLLLASLPEYSAWLRTADASGDFQLTAALAGVQEAPFLKFSGQASLDDFEIAEPGKNLVSVAWRQLDIVTREVFFPLPVEGQPLRTIRADVKSLTLVDPKIFYSRPWSPLEDFVVSSIAGPLTPTSAEAVPDWINLSVDSLEVSGGEISLHDTTVSSASTVRDVSVSMRDFCFPEPVFGSLALSANLPSDSKLTVHGRLGAGQTGNFVIALQDLDLPPLSPYAEAAGVALKEGRATLQTTLETRGAVVRADNEIVFNKLGLSMKNPDSFAKEFGMPINLALVLLRDASGNIKLKVPVQMDEKGTSVSFGSVLGSAMRAAVLGAISSPLKVVGMGLGEIGRPESNPGKAPPSVAQIPCLPGNQEPTPGADTHLGKFVKLLAERPEVGLVLRGRTGNSDRPVLAEQFLIAQVRAGKGLPEVEGAGFLTRRWISQFLTKRGKGESVELDPKDLELFKRFLAAAEIPEEHFAALANARAERVRQSLIAKGANPKSVTLGEPEPAGEPGTVITFSELARKAGKSQTTKTKHQ